MNIWIVEPTDYDQYGIYGVYSSLELAKASVPYVKTWVEESDGSYSAGLDRCGKSVHVSIVQHTMDTPI